MAEKESAFLELDPSSAPQFTNYRSGQSHINTPFALLPETGKYTIEREGVAGSYSTDTPFALLPENGKYPVNSEGVPSSPDSGKQPQPSFFKKWKKWIIIGGLVLLAIIIAAATAGGVVGSRKSSESPSSASSDNGSPTSTSTTSESTSTDSSDSKNTTTNVAKDSWAYNGTDFATLTFSTTKDTTGTNYVVFFQHSNEDIRQVVHNNSVWHGSEFISDDARPGSPLSVFWHGDNYQYTLFYVDKNNILQETRGRHASSSWLNGTVGQLSVEVKDPGDISVVYIGSCASGISGWMLYSPMGEDDTIGILHWDGVTDTWTHGGNISNANPDAGFAAQNNVGIWRNWYFEKSTSELKENVCTDCCTNSSSAGFHDDLPGPTVDDPGWLSMWGVGLPRLIYYSEADNGTIRELNNSYQYPNEAYMADVSSHAKGGNSGTPNFGNTSTSMPEGMAVAEGIPNGRFQMASGFRGELQQLWLFYQGSEHDLTFQTRDSEAAGNWSEPATIPVDPA